MNRLSSDCIAIDTNVFLHLFNGQENINDHIDELLRRLAEDSIALLVDEDGLIEQEYEDKLSQKIAEESDTDSRTFTLRF